MENKRIIYDFCPRCNGLMKNGCCMACGYAKSQKEKTEKDTEKTADKSMPGSVGMPGNGSVQDGSGMSGNGGNWSSQSFSDSRQPERLQTPEKTKHTAIIVGICIGAALFILILCLAVYLIVNDLGSGAKKEKDLSEAVSDEWNGIFAAEESDGEDSNERNDAADSDDGYVPDAQDEYYVTIVDSLRDDLDYSVEWVNDEIVSEDGESSLYMIYPQLTGNIPYIEWLNEKIQEAGRTGENLLAYAEEDDFKVHILNEGYVTYMDENTLSIVFLEYVYIDDIANYLPRIMDLNIDVKSGDVLSHEEMVDYGAALTEKVYQQNQYQNSTDLEELGWSNEYIEELLQGYDGVAFYTPVGLEVGFNYDDDESGAIGWITVTIKETETYGKREWP